MHVSAYTGLTRRQITEYGKQKKKRGNQKQHVAHGTAICRYPYDSS